METGADRGAPAIWHQRSGCYDRIRAGQGVSRGLHHWRLAAISFDARIERRRCTLRAIGGDVRQDETGRSPLRLDHDRWRSAWDGPLGASSRISLVQESAGGLAAEDAEVNRPPLRCGKVLFPSLRQSIACHIPAQLSRADFLAGAFGCPG